MIHDLEIQMMRRASWREQRLFLEPRCHLSIFTIIGVGLGVGGGLAAAAAGLSVVAGITASGVSIAAAVGAFSPDAPSGANGTESTVAPKQQIIDLQTNLAALADQEKKTEDALSASQASQRKWQYAAAGLALVAVAAAAFVALEKGKKK